MAPVIEKETGPTITELELRLARLSAAQSPQLHSPVSDRDDRTTPADVPQERWKLATANIRHLSWIIGQLVELMKEPETDDYGILRPTRHAFDTACHLLTDAAIVSALAGRQIPRGCASTDAEGGLRIEWVREKSSVHLAVPATPERDGYVYHEIDHNYGTVSATPEALARWLRDINP